jgi:hypothetical protein
MMSRVRNITRARATQLKPGSSMATHRKPPYLPGKEGLIGARIFPRHHHEEAVDDAPAC